MVLSIQIEMPEFDSTTLAKINELRAISSNWSEPLEVYQLLKIDWAEPSGAVYYAATQVDELSPTLPVAGVVPRIIADGFPDCFLSVSSTAALSDDEIDLKLWDGDGIFSDLVQENGEGVKVELFFWFPAVDLLLSDWWGHLRTGEDCDQEFWLGKIAVGFRSPNLNLPRRAHYQSCQAIFGGMLETQDEIDHSGCPYNRHIGGGTGLLNGGVPFTSCPRKTFGDCSARLGDKLSHLSHQSVTESQVNYQTKGPALLATSRGNETNLKRAVRVVMGHRWLRDLDLLASVPQYNTKTPDKGFWRVMFELCEGPIAQVLALSVDGQNCFSSSNANSLNIRYGQARQSPTSFSPNVHNYSSTALFSYVYGWVNPSTTKVDSLKAEAYVQGLSDVKEYTSESEFVTGLTNNRAWHIFRMLTDRRWGYGLDESRINIPSFIATGIWAVQMVDFLEPETGAILRHQRAISDVELNERTTMQQIEDMCWAGRFSRPFVFQGKLHIVPIKTLTLAELDECPVFSDTGDEPNIIVEDNKSTLTRSQISDLDLPNRIELTYDNILKGHREEVISVEDVDQQLRAGRVLGDTSLRVVPKKESALGVVVPDHAVKLAWSVLDLGKFDEGGLKNNLEIRFKAWFLDCLKLHPYKVIKVVSNQLSRYGFEYFRIKEINRESNLQVEIVAQAYNVEYMNAFENVQIGPPALFFPGLPNEVIPLNFGSITYQNGYLEVEIVPGVL